MPLNKPPIAVHLVWNFSDNDSVSSIIAAILKELSRDINKPFSRNINIPLFFYSSDNPSITPNDYPKECAERDIVFVFTSVNTRGRTNWNSFIATLPNSSGIRIVPVALCREGLGHGMEGSLKDLNFIRSYEWSIETKVQQAVLAIAHEIYRHGFFDTAPSDAGKTSSIKIFLSHAKNGNTGLLHAESIKRFIENTNMSHFFDAVTISPGFKFNDEITKHINESTLVAICSDDYSSRYWCQREILCAKELQRPMVVVNCLEEYEDRIFPANSNVPCIHVTPDVPLKETDVLKILTVTLLETIRHCYALASLMYYRNSGWISSDCEVSSRPPEIRQLLAMKKSGLRKNLCYPEPPIYSEEAEWHQQLDINTFTPLWNSFESNSLHGVRVGISISDVSTDGFKAHHLHPTQTIRLAQDLARHLLARSAILIYGGDLRKDGFTEFVLDEAIALKNRLNNEDIHVENHLAWPLYKADREIVAWRAKYKPVMETVEHNAADDVAGDIDNDTFLPPSTQQNRYIWSRCLTEMRLKSIQSSQARICAGGKLSGYNGKMPGVLEEIIIALQKDKPVYLLGAFGGVVGEVCKVVRKEGYPEFLTEAWQVTHNAGYADLQTIAAKNGNHADYEQVELVLKCIDVSKLANKAGLNDDEYLRLMGTPFVDECIHLIMLGLKKICAAK